MGHVFRHPDYYKKLKASNKLVSASTDQLEPEAPSDKQQAIDETVPHCDIEEASSDKQQAATIDHINKKEKNE